MTEPLTLSRLVDRASVSTMEGLYEFLQYDYAKIATFETVECDQERESFLSAIAWKVRPSKTLVRRLFNQINSYYAERRLLQHLHGLPSDLLYELNRLLLFRQGKVVGIRQRPIEYGYRVHLDFMDPFRRMKWLAGASPHHISALLQQWSATVERCAPSKPCALALSMFLIAIHPFVDGNGRLARLVYTWLCERWGVQGDKWLGEGGDGELLRTSHGIRGTEYLMAQLIITLSDGANEIDPGSGGYRADSDCARMSDGLQSHLVALAAGKNEIISHPAFERLLWHLESDGHFRKTSPRFESLRFLLQ